MKLLLVATALLLAAAPTAAAVPTADASECGVGNNPVCWAESFVCNFDGCGGGPNVCPDGNAPPCQDASAADVQAACGVIGGTKCFLISFLCDEYYGGSDYQNWYECCWIAVGCVERGPEVALGVQTPTPRVTQPANCNNYGVVIMATVIGHNDYCSGGKCTNAGLIVFVGETTSCHGSGLAGVCAGDTCKWQKSPPPAS